MPNGAAGAATATPVTVVLCIDRAFEPQVGVIATALALNARTERPIHLHVLSDGAPQRRLRRLDGLAAGPVRIDVHRVSNGLAHLGTKAHVSPASFLRFAIPDVLPGAQRALYIDADVLPVVDICELFDTDLGGKPLGAVRDLGLWLQRDWPITSGAFRGTTVDYLRDVLRLQSPDPMQSYFNSGVLLMDLERFRACGLSKLLVAEAARWGNTLHWRDQDVLNMTLEGQVAWLDPRWNALVEPVEAAGRYRSAPQALRDGIARQIALPGLVHFSAAARPWLSPRPLWQGQAWWRAALQSPDAAQWRRRHAQLGCPPVADLSPAALPIEPAQRGGRIVALLHALPRLAGSGRSLRDDDPGWLAPGRR